MKLYVVRHAHAGSRSAWTGDDRLRPLSKKGWRQAEAIAAKLANAGITSLVSSPYVRCVESLQPLSDKIGVPIETDDGLAEGHDASEALALVNRLRDAGELAVAICSHGDVIPDLLTDLKVTGTTFHGLLTWPKGSIWEITSDGDRWTDARHVPPD